MPTALSLAVAIKTEPSEFTIQPGSWTGHKERKNDAQWFTRHVCSLRRFPLRDTLCFYAALLTLSRFKLFPSLVQLTYSTGGSAWTGQIMTPSMPAGKYVSRDIRPTRAGSEMEEEELITKSKDVLAQWHAEKAQATCNGYSYKQIMGVWNHTLS